MSKLTQQLKVNRDNLLEAAEKLYGVEGREADVSFAMTRAAEIDQQLKVARRFQVREPGIYDVDSPYSWVADTIAAYTPVLYRGLPDRFSAQARLARFNQYDLPKEQAKLAKRNERAASDFGIQGLRDGYPISARALTAEGVTTGGAFVPPAFMLDQYGEASRANGVASSLCKHLPLGAGFDMVIIPNIVESYNPNPTFPENTPVFQGGVQTTGTQIVVGVRSYSQITPLSLQLLERGGNILDQVLTADANAGIEEQLDLDLLQGSGQPEAVVPGVGTVAGQILGLVNWPNVPAVTYTSSSPNSKGQLVAIGNGIASVDQLRRRPPQMLLGTPDRYHQLAASTTSAGMPLQPLGIGNDDAPILHSADPMGYVAGLPWYACYGCGYTYGAGENEDIVIATRLEADSVLLTSAPTFNFLQEGYGANSLTVLFVARVYAAFALRITNSTCVVGGTGFVVGVA